MLRQSKLLPRARLLCTKPLLRQRIPGRGWFTLTSEKDGPASTGGSGSSSMDDVKSFAWRGAVLTMLPRGYPHTVAGRYLPYVGWTSLGLLCGRMQSVLATQAALFAAGLSAGAIPMAVAVQWVLKDGVGHAGAIVYAASVNTRFDADAKRYRFHSTLALTVADVIAVLMPLAPQHFFVMASLSSTTSSIANLAQVSSRARIMASFAVKGNLADCVRAGQTQGKLMSLIGTGAGAGLSWVLGPDPITVLSAMAPLAAISIYSMHESSRIVVLRTLNVQRAERVYLALLDRLEQSGDDAGEEEDEGGLGPSGDGAYHQPPTQASLTAPTPEEISQVETFVWPYASLLPGEMVLQPLFDPTAAAAAAPFPMRQTESSKLLAAALPALESAAAAAQSGKPKARVVEDVEWRAAWCEGYAIAAGGGGRVALWHAGDASTEDKMRAVWHAAVLRRTLGSSNNSGGGAGDESAPLLPRAAWEAASATADATWPAVHAALVNAGWDLTSAHLDGCGGSLHLGRGGKLDPVGD